jgi:hypothetical protein
VLATRLQQQVDQLRGYLEAVESELVMATQASIAAAEAVEMQNGDAVILFEHLPIEHFPVLEQLAQRVDELQQQLVERESVMSEPEPEPQLQHVEEQVLVADGQRVVVRGLLLLQLLHQSSDLERAVVRELEHKQEEVGNDVQLAAGVGADRVIAAEEQAQLSASSHHEQSVVFEIDSPFRHEVDGVQGQRSEPTPEPEPNATTQGALDGTEDTRDGRHLTPAEGVPESELESELSSRPEPQPEPEPEPDLAEEGVPDYAGAGEPEYHTEQEEMETSPTAERLGRQAQPTATVDTPAHYTVDMTWKVHIERETSKTYYQCETGDWFLCEETERLMAAGWETHHDDETGDTF